MRKLVSTGAHLAYRTTHSNFQPYLYGFRNEAAIIDLENTLFYLRRACNVINSVVRSKGNLLIVNTNLEYNQIVQHAAKQTNQSYINYKWIGGLLTNWNHMQNVQRHFEPFANRSRYRLESQYSKHEANKRNVLNTRVSPNSHVCSGSKQNTQTKEWRELLFSLPQFHKMEKGFEGLLSFPDCIIILNANQNYNAICEAAKLQIPIISLVDSTIPNRILNLISYPIPTNENSLQFVYLFCNCVVKTILHSSFCLSVRKKS